MSRHVLTRLLPQVEAHAPDGLPVEGVLVTLDGYSLPVAHEGPPVGGQYVAYQAGEPVHRMSPARWRSLVASGTAWVYAAEHVDLTAPAAPSGTAGGAASVAARDVWRLAGAAP